MECNEVVKVDHRGYFIDVDMADYFSEELIEGDVRMKRMLNLNRKTQRDLFVKKMRRNYKCNRCRERITISIRK